MMRIAIGAVAILAALSLGCDSDAAKDAAEHLENAAEEVGEAAEDAGDAVEEGVENTQQEAKSVKQQLTDDSADNKQRVKTGAGGAADDIKRTFRGLGKK